MTLYLENTSNKKTMSLRYGDGNNLLLQLNPGEKQPLPLKMNKQKLQVYLHLFKELRLVKDSNDKDDEKGWNTNGNWCPKCAEEAELLIAEIGCRIDRNRPRGRLRNCHHVEKLILVNIFFLFHKFIFKQGDHGVSTAEGE